MIPNEDMPQVALTRSGSVREREPFSLPVSRSASVRELPRKNGSYGRRRSTSYDETNDHSAIPVEIGAKGIIFSLMDQDSSRKEFGRSGQQGSSRHRWWMLGRGRKSSRWAETMAADKNNQDSSLKRLEAVNEKEEGMPKWKALLMKLRAKVKKTKNSSNPTKAQNVPSNSSANRSQRTHDESLKDKKEIKVKVQVQGDKQKPCIYPEPMTPPIRPRQSSTPPIWERRRIEQPSTLDLRSLKVTGIKHMPRAHSKK